LSDITHFSLFSGIGGIDLAAEWAGFESVGQCEFADYPTKVLEKHWPNVPRWRDIRDVTADSVRARGITNITVLSGGFPCQPFSVAGKQKGKDDDRYLWPEMLRVISELKPTWVIGENVAGFTGLVQFEEGFKVDDEGNAIGEVGELFNRTGRYIADEVLESLEKAGYEVQTFIIPACGVEALHERKRVFIVGYSKHDGLSAFEELRSNEATGNNRREKEQEQTRQSEGADRPVDEFSLYGSESGSQQYSKGTVGSGSGETNGNVADSPSKGLQKWGRPELYQSREETTTRMEPQPQRCGEDVFNTTGERLQGQGKPIKPMHTEKGGNGEASQSFDVCIGNVWAIEPNVGRVANGVPSRVDRLKCLGNAVVPQQVYPILQAIAEIERSKHNDRI